MLRGVLRKKIHSDIFDNMGRTIQVVLIIAIGSIAVGAITGALEFIQKDVTAGWMQNDPASIAFSLGDEGVDQNMVDTLRKFPEVDQVEGQLRESIKWRRSRDDEWKPATLRAREDYQDMELFSLQLRAGSWPRQRVMSVNRGYGVAPGEKVYLFINDKERLVDIGGETWYMNAPPPAFEGNPAFFATKEYFTDLTGQDEHTYLTASVPGEYTETKAIAAAVKIEDRLEGENIEVFPGTNDGTKVIDPGKHPAQDPINGVFLILQLMAFAALILGLFLVYNTITAIISRQVPQIGVLKAIGATYGQILILYYTMVFFYGVMAAVVSVPLGAMAAHGLRVWMVNFIAMDPGPLGLSTQTVLLQLAICIISPLLIATLPIFRGAGITVREAISSYGLTGGGGLLDRLIAKIAFLPRMTSMAVSNTFRKKMRLFMTELSLVGAGILFMAVMSTQSSIRFTFGPVLFDTLRTDLLFEFEERERYTEVERVTRDDESKVRDVEMWAPVRGEIRPKGQPEAFGDRTVSITGMPIPSNIYGPQLRAGRWLLPDDAFALVMHQKEAAEIGVGVGDWVTLNIPTKRETDWQVVGLLNDPVNDKRIIAPRETLVIAQRQVGRGSDLFVTTTNTDPAQDIEVSDRLRRKYNNNGLELAATDADTLQLLSEEVISRFNIIIYLLLIMASLIAIIGGIALSGVLSINVLERRTEIGILRSIGASNNAIGILFITEGVLMGWLSWLIAVPLSLPIGQGLNAGVGAAVNAELSFEYSVTAVWVWFIIITALAIIASWFPARGAIRVSVRESLSYE